MNPYLPFLAGAFLILAITLFLLLRPFRRRPEGEGPARLSRAGINAAIYRDQLAELERDRAEGALSAADYDEASAELRRRLLEDSEEPDPPPQTVAAVPGRDMRVPFVIALALPVGVVALYLALGQPAAINPPPEQRHVSAGDIERMVDDLAAKLEKDPGNLEGWIMLGRSYKAMKRLDESVLAFEKGYSLMEGNPGLLLDYADVLAARDRSLKGRPTQLIEQALKLDPNNAMGQWLAGTAAFEVGDHARAVNIWEKLLKQLPADSEGARTLTESIAKARAAAKAR